MARWVSYIDNSVGDGANTIAGIISNGPTYGIGISSDVYITGLSTFSDVARFSSTVRLDGQLRDGDNNFGSSGQVLSSDGTDTRWVNAGSLSAGAASQVAINDDGNTNASRFLTFVDSSSGNNSIKTDPQLTYNPSTNVISTAGIELDDDKEIVFGDNSDLKIYHDPSSNGGSKIDHVGHDDLRLRIGGNQMVFEKTSGENFIVMTHSSGEVDICHNDNVKLTTTSSGVTITGTATATAFSGPLTGNVTGNASGNAGSATILANARTIGGVSFNGSANINLPGVNQAGNQNTSGNAATATVLETTRNFSISGEITANAQSFNGSGNVTLSATVDDNVIDEANLKISNSPQNGFFLKCNTGVSGGLTWSEVTLPTAATLDGTTLASGITASSITSLGTLTGLNVNGNASVTGTLTSGVLTIDVNGTDDGSTTLLTLDNYISDIGTEYSFIDFTFRDTNGNATPQVKIGAQAQDPSGSQTQEGTADFVVQVGMDNNVSINNMTEMFRCSHEGKITSKHHHPQTDSDFDLGTNGNRWRNVYADNVYGNGSNLTSLNASQLSSGTVPDARLANSSLFVTGMIMMYTGSTAPSGWAICNGQNGTPDLRDRFIVGAGSAYSVNNTGGSADATLVSHSHTVNNHAHSFSSSHNHSFSGSTNNPGNHNHSYTRANSTNDEYQGVPIGSNGQIGPTFGNYTTGNAGGHTHSFSGTTGNGTASGTTGNAQPGTNSQGSSATNKNLPPYYALCFIMKT